VLSAWCRLTDTHYRGGEKECNNYAENMTHPPLKFIPLGGWARRNGASLVYKLSDQDLNL